MNDRPFSEEAQRQREKEERSRLRKQEQAYREAQRGVYDRIYREDERLPEDYYDARASRLPPPQEEGADDWFEQRRLIQETLRETPSNLESPLEGEEWQPILASPRQREQEEEWRPIYDIGSQEGERQKPGAGSSPPIRKGPPSHREAEGWDGPPPRRKRGKKLLLILLVVLLALLAAGVVAHQLLVRAPDLPAQEEQEAGTSPGSLGAGRREGVYTFLLLGRDDGGGGNTDTIMVGCFDTVNGTIDVLSIYRDTMVDEDWEIPKINSVYNYKGLEGVQAQIKNLIGYTPDYYFVVELDAVAELVDALGGVDYEVPYNMDYDDPSQDLHIHYTQGMQHLSGEDAVKVLRWRKNNSGERLSVGDVGRVTVQHSFLQALAKELVSLGTLTKIGQIADIVDRNLESNLSYGEMIWFGERVLGLGEESFRFHNLPGDYTGTKWSSTYQNYQSYVFVNGTALRELVNQYMNPYLTDITADMQHIVNDTDVNNLPVEEEAAAAEGETADSDTAEE